MTALQKIVIGIISSLLATLIVILFQSRKQRLKPRLIFSMMVEVLFRSGVYFYPNRKKLMRDLGTVEQFVSTAKQSLIYVGFWLASLENTNLSREIKKLALRDVTFEAYVLNPNSPLVDQLSQYFRLTPDQVKHRILYASQRISELKSELPNDKSNNIRLYYHESPITSSIFIFDRSLDSSKMMVDHKLFSTPRSDSYGIVLTKAKTQLYESIFSTYGYIIQSSSEVTTNHT